MSSPVDRVVLAQVIERHNERRRREPCPEDAEYLRQLRNIYTYDGAFRSPIIAWTLSPEWRAIPVYTQPEPVSGEFEAR